MRKDNGITMISLVVTIIIIVVILQVVMYSASNSLKIQKLNAMHADVRTLEEKIAVFYLKYNRLPITGNPINFYNTIDINQINPNDSEDGYYVIDLRQLEGITLNYAKTNSEDVEDAYLINEQSHTIYYWKGITIKDNGTNNEVTYYTIQRNYANIDLSEYQPEL